MWLPDAGELSAPGIARVCAAGAGARGGAEGSAGASDLVAAKDCGEAEGLSDAAGCGRARTAAGVGVCCAIRDAVACDPWLRSPEASAELSVDVMNSKTAMMQSPGPNIDHSTIFSRNRMYTGGFP